MSIIFYTIGDWGKLTRGLLNNAKSMDNISQTKYQPNFILSLGDNFYPSGVESTDDEQWVSKYSSIFKGKKLNCPWYSILGNHDYLSNPMAQIEYYLEKKDNRWTMPSRYYHVIHKFDNKKLHIVCLDTVELELMTSLMYIPSYLIKANNLDAKSSKKQLEWLENVLSNSDADWLIVIGHYNLYSSGYHGSNSNLINLLKPLFSKYRVDMYICGHCHNLEHLTDSGIEYIISGAGSQKSYVSKIFQSNFVYDKCGYTIHKIINNKMIVLFINDESEVIYQFEIPQKRNL